MSEHPVMQLNPLVRGRLYAFGQCIARRSNETQQSDATECTVVLEPNGEPVQRKMIELMTIKPRSSSEVFVVGTIVDNSDRLWFCHMDDSVYHYEDSIAPSNLSPEAYEALVSSLERVMLVYMAGCQNSPLLSMWLRFNPDK